MLCALSLAFLLSSCSHLPREVPGRPATPLEPELARALRPRHPGLRLELQQAEQADSYVRYVFSFQTYSDLLGDFETVSGDYYRTLAGAQEKAPLLVLSPILAGPVDDYRASRYFCGRACGVGISAFFLHQEKIILDGERDAVDLEAMIRESIRNNIKALDLFCQRPEVDSERLGSLGISLGAIKNVVLIASEPRLKANVLCLAGADLARILLESRENLVRKYLESRLERDGLRPEEVAAEVRRFFVSEPARVAGAVTNDRVLLFLGRFDDKVPYASGCFLREKLGYPETYILPLGHYTGVLAAPWVAGVALEWAMGRFAVVQDNDLTAKSGHHF